MKQWHKHLIGVVFCLLVMFVAFHVTVCSYNLVWQLNQ